MNEPLTSVRNPLIMKLRALKEKRGRLEHGLFVVEGQKLMMEALDCGLEPRVVLISEPGDVDLAAFERAGAQIYPVSDSVIEAVCDTKTPQGCCAAFAMPQQPSLNMLPNRLVALDGVQDPGNVGAIWRTADAAGFEAMVLGKNCADPYAPKVQRSAMGSGFRVPVIHVEDLAETLRECKAGGYDIIVSELSGTSFYDHAPLSDKFLLVIGSEARGATEQVMNQATMRLKLPMRGGAESLNAAVAAGIMMYELTRELCE